MNVGSLPKFLNIQRMKMETMVVVCAATTIANVATSKRWRDAPRQANVVPRVLVVGKLHYWLRRDHPVISYGTNTIILPPKEERLRCVAASKRCAEWVWEMRRG